MTAQHNKLSAIIACYKDEQAIPLMYERLTKVFQKLNTEYEIIFVNDSSPDNSAKVLENLAAKDKSVIVINHSRNFGSQNAFTSGMHIATGDAVILLDGDLQDPPELIEAFHQKWKEGYQVVYGTRVRRVATIFLQIAYKLFYRLFRAASYIPMPLDAGDFSLLDRKVVNALNRLPENNRFLRGLRAWVGFKQVGVPYVRPERVFGRTTNSLSKNLGWAKKAIFSFSYIPLHFISALSFIIVLSSFALIAYQVGFRILYPGSTPSGFSTLIILVLFLGGIQLLCLAIIGSYLEHMYDEVKRRPPFIVESTLNKPDRHTPEEQA